MDAKTSTTPKTGQLTLGDKSYSFPVYEGAIGPEVLVVLGKAESLARIADQAAPASAPSRAGSFAPGR